MTAHARTLKDCGSVERDWEGRTVYVIGGGPSLIGFPFEKLQGGVLLGCNKSAWIANCDALVTIDQHFTRMCRQEILEFVNRGGSAYLGVPINERTKNRVPGAVYLEKQRGTKLWEKPNGLAGAHTGFAALNLAYLKGSTDIRLLGLDMRPGEQNRIHWHDSYPWQSGRTPKFYDKWRNFQQAEVQLRAARVTVTTYGPTAIVEFPNEPLEALL